MRKCLLFSVILQTPRAGIKRHWSLLIAFWRLLTGTHSHLMQYIFPNGAPKSGNHVDPSSFSSLPKWHSVKAKDWINSISYFCCFRFSQKSISIRMTKLRVSLSLLKPMWIPPPTRHSWFKFRLSFVACLIFFILRSSINPRWKMEKFN